MTSTNRPVSVERNEPYPPWAVPAAALGTFVAPVISLIVGGAMLSGEQNSARRHWLRTWVIASVGWMVLWLIIVIALFASVSSSASSCRGGIDRYGNLPTYDSTDGKHWTATYACANGGSTTIPVPAKDVPGGGR